MDRTLKELIPDGYELVTFSSHQPIYKLTPTGREYEMVYRPYIIVRRKVNDMWMEFDTYLTEAEVRTLMQMLADTNQTITQGEAR